MSPDVYPEPDLQTILLSREQFARGEFVSLEDFRAEILGEE